MSLEAGETREAAGGAYRAMLRAAEALIRTEKPDLVNEPEEIVRQFKTRFHDTRRFHDPFAGAKFANYLFRAHHAASTLEQEEVFEGRLRIPDDRWTLRIQDRLLAPNDESTFAAVEPELRGLYTDTEAEVRLRREPDSRGWFGIQVEAS